MTDRDSGEEVTGKETQMSARDQVVSEMLASLDRGYRFIRRPDHTVEIWDEPEEGKKIPGQKLENCGSCTDDDGHEIAWLMSFMENPPAHIVNKRAPSNGDRTHEAERESDRLK